MQTRNWSIHILASKEKVWHTMLDDVTYREWTKVFNSGSHFEGIWDQGSEIYFLGVDEETGENVGGMYSRIKENRLYEFISIEHLGFIKDGVVDTASEEVQKWTPAFESYTFTEKDGGTELLVELDLADEHIEMFDDMWPRALTVLKELAEK